MKSRHRKVGYILTKFPVLSETFILSEILGLKELGLDISIFSFKKGEEKIIQNGADKVLQKVIYLPHLFSKDLFLANLWAIKRYPKNYLEAVRRSVHFKRKSSLIFGAYIAKIAKKLSISHIHAHYAYHSSEAGLVCSTILGIPFSFTAHANDIYKGKFGRICKKIRWARFCTTCTAFNKNYLDRCGKNVHLIYHGIEPKREELKLKKDGYTVISCGRLREKKGFYYLIKAARILKDKGIQIKVGIIGEGDERDRLESLIDELGLKEEVYLLGAMKREDVLSEMGKAKVFCLPCVVAKDGAIDGIPNTILEAISSFTPVISTNISGIPEVIVSGKSGILVRERDELAIAEAIEKLIFDRKISYKFKKLSNFYINRKFSQKENLEKLLNLINESSFLS